MLRRNEFMHEFMAAARQGPRIFFAPVIGAVKAVQTELGYPTDLYDVTSVNPTLHRSERKQQR